MTQAERLNRRAELIKATGFLTLIAFAGIAIWLFVGRHLNDAPALVIFVSLVMAALLLFELDRPRWGFVMTILAFGAILWQMCQDLGL